MVYHMYDVVVGVVVIGGRSCVVDAGGCGWLVDVGGRSFVGCSAKFVVNEVVSEVINSWSGISSHGTMS